MPAHADRFDLGASPAAAFDHAVPHRVVPQLLRPEAADFMGAGRVVMRSHDDELCCVGSATFIAEDKFGPPDITYLSAFPHLSRVTAEEKDIDAATFTLLPKKLPQLQYLALLECNGVDAAALAEVGKLTQLHHLDLDSCPDVDAAGVAEIAKMKKLQHLNLSGCGGVDTANLAEVAKVVTGLRFLNLSLCDGVDVAGLAEVAKLTQLQHLNVGYCGGVDATGIACLTQLQQLQRLLLNFCDGVDATGLAEVAKLTQLHFLDLGYCDGVDAAGLTMVAKLQKLQRLTLDGCDGVDVAGLAAIAKMSSLRDLSLYGCTVSVASLAEVAKLTQLQFLCLGSCKGVNVQALAEVAKLHDLRYLNLSSCDGVDASGLAAVAKLKHLQYLDLDGEALASVMAAEVVAPADLVALTRFTELSFADAIKVLLGHTVLGAVAAAQPPRPQFRAEVFVPKQARILQQAEVQALINDPGHFSCCGGKPGCRGVQDPDEAAAGETRCWLCHREMQYCEQCGRYYDDGDQRECCGIPRGGQDIFSPNSDDLEALHNSRCNDDKFEQWLKRNEGKKPWGPVLMMRHLGRIAAALFHMQRNQPVHQKTNLGPRNTLAAVLQITGRNERACFDSFLNNLWRSCYFACRPVPGQELNDREMSHRIVKIRHCRDILRRLDEEALAAFNLLAADQTQKLSAPFSFQNRRYRIDLPKITKEKLCADGDADEGWKHPARTALQVFQYLRMAPIYVIGLTREHRDVQPIRQPPRGREVADDQVAVPQDADLVPPARRGPAQNQMVI